MIRRDRPTLDELRARVHKGRHREIGNWLARRVGRPSAVYGTWLAVRLGISAHQATTAALASTLGAAVALGTGTARGLLVGVVLLHLAFWLDHVDGQLARWRGSASLDGVYYDYILHHVWNLCVGFSLGMGLAARAGDVRWAAAGFAVALGWTVLGLSNDARYKAFFQRLKSDPRSFRVEGGSGGRPAPAPDWPRSGRGVLTWPAYKCCEPHVILIGLTLLLAVPGGVRPTVLAWAVRGMACLAPALAAARVARAIRRGAVEAEFDRWFRPEEGEERPSPVRRGLDSAGRPG